MPLARAALEDVVRIAIVPGIGPARLAALIARFGSAERILSAPAAAIAAVPGFGPEFARRVAGAGSPEGRARAREALRVLAEVGATAITSQDEAYPEAFRGLPDPPFVLYAAGDLGLLYRPGVGVVGTRAPTPYGRASAAGLTRELARAGYVVVSGMAKGIDAVAHAAALDAGGATVGVLGHGIDRAYPPENRGLFRRVREHGLLISELPPGEEPLAGNFPRRNRLIAALSAGVLVVEMGEKSGAKHTVDFALELGREVFAVPGPIGSAASAGTNQLLKDGARLVTSARDILEELHGVGLVPHQAEERRSAAAPFPAASHARPVALAGDELRVFRVLRPDPRHVDALADDAGLGVSGTLAALLGLELHDLAEALPGKHFKLR
jgi:DNA processing protein